MRHHRQASFFVTSHPTPPALPQLLGLFADHGHVPARVRSRLLGQLLQVDVDVVSLTDGEADLLAARLRDLPTVTSVRYEQVEGQAAA